MFASLWGRSNGWICKLVMGEICCKLELGGRAYGGGELRKKKMQRGESELSGGVGKR